MMVNAAEVVPEWARGDDELIPWPSAPPALAAATAARAAAGACGTAAAAFAATEPMRVWGARLHQQAALGAQAFSHPGARTDPAGRAVRAARAAAQAADGLALMAFVLSGALAAFERAYGDGPNAVRALEVLAGQDGPWDVAAAAAHMRAAERRELAAAQRMLDALADTPGVRAMRRWRALPQAVATTDPSLDEVRYRIAAGQGVSGATGQMTGNIQRRHVEWAKWTDDEQVLQWARQGVAFNVTSKVTPYNCAIDKAGRLREDGGNLPGAITEQEWVTQVLEELLVLGVIRDMGRAGHADTVVPTIVAPLNVAPKGGGGKRLCYDGRKANESITPEAVRLETLQRMRFIWQRRAWLVTWDLKSAYWTLALTEAASMLCGCCWQGRYFVWVGLPFGVSDAVYIFQTVTWAQWRPMRCGRHALLPMRPQGEQDTTPAPPGVVGITYIDDGAATAKCFWDALWMAAYAMVSLIRLGWIINWKKSRWTPRRRGCVLGINVHLDTFTFEITAKARGKIAEAAHELIKAADAGVRVPVRAVASFAGRVMSTYLVTGDAAYIYTKDAYTLITRAVHQQLRGETRRRWVRAAWNAMTKVSALVREEAAFWLETIPHVQGAAIEPLMVPAKLMALGGVDTSDRASGGFMVSNHSDRLRVFHQRLRSGETEESSTKRELLGMERLLQAAAPGMQEEAVVLYCDTQCGARALRKGSNTPDVHRAARAVWQVALTHAKKLYIQWLPRTTREIELCDDLSKLVAEQDWMLDPQVFEQLSRRWGRPTVDAFADEGNAQLPRFWTRFMAAGSAGVDAFTQQWTGEYLWCYPPFALVGRVLQRAQSQRARLALVAPAARETPFGALLATGAPGVVDRLLLPQRAGLVRGRSGAPATLPRAGMVAVLIDHGRAKAERPRGDVTATRPARAARVAEEEQGAADAAPTKSQRAA